MKQFTLKADIETTEPQKVEGLLRDLIGVNGVMRTDYGFKVTATIAGESAQELNRSLLSALERVSESITLRAQWAHGSQTEKFFDYLPRGMQKGERE